MGFIVVVKFLKLKTTNNFYWQSKNLIVVRIAVDCMGGDFGLPVTLPASVQVAREYPDVHFLLVGDQAQIEKSLKSAKPARPSQFTVIHAEESIQMDDSVEVADRKSVV